MGILPVCFASFRNNFFSGLTPVAVTTEKNLKRAVRPMRRTKMGDCVVVIIDYSFCSNFVDPPFVTTEVLGIKTF